MFLPTSSPSAKCRKKPYGPIAQVLPGVENKESEVVDCEMQGHFQLFLNAQDRTTVPKDSHLGDETKRNSHNPKI